MSIFLGVPHDVYGFKQKTQGTVCIYLLGLHVSKHTHLLIRHNTQSNLIEEHIKIIGTQMVLKNTLI